MEAEGVVTPFEAFAADERRAQLPPALSAFCEAAYRDLEIILSGCPNHPAPIWHLIDKARIAAGFLPINLWEDEV